MIRHAMLRVLDDVPVIFRPVCADDFRYLARARRDAERDRVARIAAGLRTVDA